MGIINQLLPNGNEIKRIKIRNTEKKGFVIWIDPELDDEENITYAKELIAMANFKVKLFKKVYDAINFIRTIKFEETKIIISGKLYSKFIQNFKENLKDMCVSPKIIVFTNNEYLFVKNDMEYQNINNVFYKFGGIAIQFDLVKSFLLQKVKINTLNYIASNQSNKNNNEKENNIQLTFEYIDKKEKLLLPLFYKTLIDNVSNNSIEEYTNYLYKTYSANNNSLKNLLESIVSMKDIPKEILSKYYAKLYTSESKFYSELNKDLRLNKVQKHLPFIKILYEGVKLKSLPLASDNKLYRGAFLSQKEIMIIKNHLVDQKKDLPGSIIFSKCFLSFSKDSDAANKFLRKQNNNNDLFKVIFILEKDDNLDYELSTHGDIEEISFFPKEREVLFFPYSCFAIKSLKQINFDAYEIELLYLGKYLKSIENDNDIITREDIIPNSKFKQQINESGLIQKEKIENLMIKNLYNLFKKYAKEVKRNIIFGEIKITEKDLNKNIFIINSFENAKRLRYINPIEFNNDIDYNNEEEIKNNIKIKINGVKIGFNYFYKFSEKGKYKIEYIFKKKLSHTNHLFYECSNLTRLNLSNFKMKNVNNMSSMFHNCKSLKKLNLSDLCTNKVNNTSYMFSGCRSLKSLDLSSFNTKNIYRMDGMFYECESLIKLDLSNFYLQNNCKIKKIFYGCNSLEEKNIKTSCFKLLNELDNQ